MSAGSGPDRADRNAGVFFLAAATVATTVAAVETKTWWMILIAVLLGCCTSLVLGVLLGLLLAPQRESEPPQPDANEEG